ncbi:efflux RND transporter permease subunit [candidate division KSB1 bacterium]|nr:efflux RND transporter permease subunit [candidate division KSB1 bacterium]MBL7093371.1 efflux RND transporter permease subunit [candidate division KSB1 bacterium]
MNLTETSLRRPVTILMIFACFIVIGIISSRLLPLEYFPDLDAPFIAVEIPYPGSTPEEIERQITRPAEEVLATISGIKRMQSNSGENHANVFLEFDWGIDANVKALEAKEKLDGIRNQFPSDLERFFVHKFSTSDMELITLRISSNRDLSNSYDMLNRNLKRRIERLEGVSKVDLYGVEKKEIRIQLSADRIISHRIDISRLTEMLRRSNFLVTAGKITDNNQRFVVRPIGEFQSIEEIGDLIVGKNNIRLRDIATVTHDHPRLNYGRHLDRRYAIGLNVYKEAGSNLVDVANRVVVEVEEIGKLPEMEGISIFYFSNLAEGVVSSLNEVLKSGLFGGLLAILVLFFFLRRLTTTLMVSLAVPLSLLITLAFMYFLGVSLNILSMMGLMLAVGMLVDNAVVVTESIHRHRLKEPKSKKAITKGVKEVSLAITAGTITTAIVFLPNIVSSQDQISIWLKHVAITICIALGVSLILAQTLVPLLATRIKPPKPNKNETIIDKSLDRYSNVLKWTLSHRWISVGIIFLILFSIAIPMKLVKMEMFDEAEDRRLRLHYHINGSYALGKVEEAVDVFEKHLFAHQDEFEIKSIYSYYTNSYAMSTLILTEGKDASKSMEKIKEEIRAGLPKLAVANPSFDYRDERGQGESIRVQLIGKSSEQLAELSREVAWTLSKIEGLKDVRSEAEIGEEEVVVIVDRKRAKQYGFTTQQVANIVSAAMRGINLRRFHDEDGEVMMRLEFQDTDKQSLDNLKNVPLFNNTGKTLTLESLADFKVRRGPRNIHRENRTTAIGVRANLQDLTVSEAKEKIGFLMRNFSFPAGYTWNYGQSFDEEAEAFNSMLINLLLALALIYFVMASLFESLIFPAAIWTQIIFAVVGVYWFFLITGTAMSIMGMIGILILIGVVVNNGIVLIDYVNQLRANGLDRHQAIIQAGRDRLRPIIMTAGTTVLSLVPLCVVTTQVGGYGPPYFPMARSIVGGLTFSTIVTLLILPTIYVMLDDLRNWARRVVSVAKQ